jgi:predicted nucleic acid-binding protein
VTDKVVDASAIVALVFNETTREAVVGLLREAALHAPDLLGFEVANACLKKMRASPREADVLMEAFRSFTELDVQFHATDLSAAIDVADRLKLSVYDASYLLLAVTLEVELVTLDAKLTRAYETLRASTSA